jgi:hypothetical protein
MLLLILLKFGFILFKKNNNLANLNNKNDTISKKIGILNNDTEAITNDDSSKLLYISNISFIQKTGARTEKLLESMFQK